MTPPVPSRDSASGRAYNDVRNLARRHDRDPAEYFTLYALEGVLGRLALSASASDFVLKGGVLMAAFAARRPTRDIDMAARGFANDIAEVERRIRTIRAVKRDDGLSFDPASVRGEEIRDEADCTGVRVGAVAQLATAHVALHIDVNFGDPIWPAPTEAVLPLLLGGSLRLVGYPDHGSGRCGAGGSASRRGRRRASPTFLVNVWRSPSRRSQGESGSGHGVQPPGPGSSSRGTDAVLRRHRIRCPLEAVETIESVILVPFGDEAEAAFRRWAEE